MNWQRSMLWSETGLPWILPSPNLPTARSALFYISTVFIEATTVSEGWLHCGMTNKVLSFGNVWSIFGSLYVWCTVGRGTTIPFEMFGAPHYDAAALAGRCQLQIYLCFVVPATNVLLVLGSLNGDLTCSTQTTLCSSNGTSTNQGCFREAYYSPTFFKYNNSLVSGVQWVNYPMQTHQIGTEPTMTQQRYPAMYAAVTILRHLIKFSPAGQC